HVTLAPGLPSDDNCPLQPTNGRSIGSNSRVCLSSERKLDDRGHWWQWREHLGQFTKPHHRSFSGTDGQLATLWSQAGAQRVPLLGYARHQQHDPILAQFTGLLLEWISLFKCLRFVWSPQRR